MEVQLIAPVPVVYTPALVAIYQSDPLFEIKLNGEEGSPVCADKKEGVVVGVLDEEHGSIVRWPTHDPPKRLGRPGMAGTKPQ